MVRAVRIAIIVAVAALAAGLLAPNALAQNWTPEPGGGARIPSGPGSHGQSGNPAQTTVNNCSLYATASSFGLSCITGSSSDVKTVREILAGDPAPTCWDELIPDSDLASKYQYPPNPAAPYYLHSCLTGLDMNRSLYDQPDLAINQQVIEIPAGAPHCPRPFTDAMVGTCVMWLTANQQQIVSATTALEGQIPGITITTQPSTRVRTNEEVAYVDAATDVNGKRLTRTPDYRVGGVTMWAQMKSFTIHPYGPAGESLPCAGPTDFVGPKDTPQTKPDACWWKYPRSSAGQPGQVYPFRAEADWTVYYNDRGTTRVLASFEKYDDLSLPVYDIQTLVVP